MAGVQATFNWEAARRAREEGLEAAAMPRPALLELARDLARGIARRVGTVTADDVQAALLELGYQPKDLGNAAGALFRGAEWEQTGDWRRSARVSNHGHRNPVWRLAP